jgi:GntR family transcriptional regulator, transcriptional repressor for pyruvate dehydrogenase complex
MTEPAEPPRDWRRVGLVRPPSDAGAGTLPEQIAARISELIDAGDLAPGARLPSERELARIFGVSRLAVREAEHRLEARGLVVVRRGAGSFVSAVVARDAPAAVPQAPAGVDLDELEAVRMVLEPTAAEWAAQRADAPSIRVLNRIADQFEGAAEDDQPRYDLLAAADVELHLELARCAENTLLAYFVEQLQTGYRLRLEWSLRRPGRLAQTAAEHRAIVDAVTAGDPDAARAAMQAHLAAAMDSFRAAAVGDGNPVD